MGRPVGQPEPPPRMEDLLQSGLSRDRANMAVQIGTQRFSVPWTRSQLATNARVNVRQVREIEQGARDPAFTTVIRIARALRFHALDELLGPLPLSQVPIEPSDPTSPQSQAAASLPMD